MYETPEQKASLHTQLVKWLGDCENSTSETLWLEEAEEDYKFYAGDQDTLEVKMALEAQNRPNTTYNEVQPKINMLVGMGAQLDGAVTLMPRTIEDGALTELMIGAVDFFREKMRQNRKESSCFEHSVKSGKSWLHFYVDETDKENKLKSQRVPGRYIHCDPDSIEYDKTDARFLFRDKWFTAEDIEAAWDQFKFPRDASGNVIQDTFPGVQQSHAYTPTFFNQANDKHRVVEAWFRKYEKKVVFLSPLTGQQEEMFESEFKNFKASLKQGLQLPNGGTVHQEDIASTSYLVRSIYYAIFNAFEILDVGRSIYKHNLFPYVYLEAYHDEDNNRPLSVIKPMKDPQRGLNTTRRQLIHLLQTAPKGILMHEVGAVLNIEDYEQNSSKAGYHLALASGGLEKIKFSQQPQIPNIYSQLDGLFQQSMKDSSGIQDALLGIQTSTREPGITAQMRNESSVSVLYSLFDNYKEFKYICTKILLSNIQQFITEEQVVRIKGQTGYELIKINSQFNPQAEGWNDITTAQFDIVIDNDVVTKSTRLAIAQLLQEFSHNNPGSIPAEVMLEYANIPYIAQVKVKENAAAQADAGRKEADLDTFERRKKLELEERKVIVLEKQVTISEKQLNKPEVKPKP